MTKDSQPAPQSGARIRRTAVGLLAALMLLLAACGGDAGGARDGDAASASPSNGNDAGNAPSASDSGNGAASDRNRAEEPAGQAESPLDEGSQNPAAPVDGAAPEQGGQTEQNEDSLQVVADPDSITVLVNKKNALPEDYEPDDLVYADVPFIFEEMLEKRKMRKVAAEALKELFDAAKEDGIYLAGVSAYRSRAYQKALFDSYVERDGYEKARTYSALPGTSEHETGLAIDVSGSDGKCAAQDCFAGTPEAEWLEANAHRFGFIIRYPKGKESITGYQYEPWHLRYVGKEAAEAIAEQSITLEEYLGEASI